MNEFQNLVVLNDTPAALLSTPSKIGGIVGTGYNLAVLTGGKIYNIECGGESNVPQHALALAVDKITKSVEKKVQLSEKQISGMYLGMQMDIAIQDMNNLGVIKLIRRSSDFLDAKVISDILSHEWNDVKARFTGPMSHSTREALLAVATRLRTRSAELVALQISTLVNTFPKEFVGNTVTVPIEGSLFWKMPAYKTIVQRFVEEFTGKTFHFPSIEHAGALGAAVAAIGLRG